jgi:hypothetical protein
MVLSRMPLALHQIRLPNGLAWRPGDQGIVWFLQPRLQVDPSIRPFRHRQISKLPSPMDLLEAACRQEQERQRGGQAVPTLFLMPEFSLDPDRDLERARALVSGCPANFLIVAGLGQMSLDCARTIEDADLWETPGPGALVNCASIMVGGQATVWLQPKIVPAGPERDYHCPGKVVRYFYGGGLSFVVLICSELFDRPEGNTTVQQVLNRLRAESRNLTFVMWIQHNKKPRSNAFRESLRQLAQTTPAPMVLLVSSRGDRPGRRDNFAVSGAIVPHAVLPRAFCHLDRRFHYVEPLDGVPDFARVVLLRYDAEAYRVCTALPGDLGHGASVSRSALFEQSEPCVYGDAGLKSCGANYHLEDLSALAAQMARRCVSELDETTQDVRAEVVALGTPGFLKLLDSATLPDRRANTGEDEKHEPGYLCHCWRHRDCIDGLAHDEVVARPLALLLLAAAALRAAGLSPQLLPNGAGLAPNCRMTSGARKLDVRLLDSEDITLDGVIRRMSPRSAAARALPPLVLLGSANALSSRPAVGGIDAGMASPFGRVSAENPSLPIPQALCSQQFWAAHREHRLAETVMLSFDARA